MRVFYGRKSGEQLVVSLIIYLGVAIVLLSVPGAIGGGITNNENRTSAKLQARILLESNNLDIEHEKSGSVNLSSSLGSDPHQISKNETITTTTTRAPIRRKGKKKERSSRRLSNIWSMFMPGGSSNNDQDYDENPDESEEVPVTGENNVAAAQLATTTLAPDVSAALGEKPTTTSERHDEKLVAKYSRPPRLDGLELLAVNQALSSNSQPQNQTGSTSSTTQAPISSLATGVMTGSLSSASNEVGGSTPTVAQPNMNDIVSNIISSMSLPSNTSEPVNVDGVEREEETGNKNRTGGDQFEQWLNRIQFKQAASASGISSSSSNNNRPQMMQTMNATRWLMSQAQHNASSLPHHRLQPGDVVRAMEALAAERAHSQLYHHHNQQQHDQAHHHHRNQLIISRATKTTGSELQHSKLRSPSKINQELVLRQPALHPNQPQQSQHRYKAPVQFMHLRQKSSALPVYHANRYSQAQASTLSVNLMDASASNSSSQPVTSSTTESTVGSNSTTSTSSPKSLTDDLGLNEQPQQQQQSVEQLNSQDEILKQVTSAIDFEQKLNQKKHFEQIQQEPHNADEHNNIEGLTKILKVGANLNEFVSGGGEGNGTASTPKPSGQNQQVSSMELLKASMSSRNSNNSSSPSNLVGIDDIDNNFDLIAEKLRHLAQQQQQVTNQTRQQQPPQQPSWLRPPVVGLSSGELVDGNLTRLASLLGQHQPPGVVGNLLVNQSSQATIERLRELLDKHERHKNELKSSQESMELLMRQLTALQNSNNNKVSTHHMRLRPSGLQQQRQKGPQLPVTKAHQQQLQLQQAIEGWRPLMAPPMSPAKLIKGQHHHQQPHFNRHPFRISQLQDNIGTGSDYINDDLTNLGLMFGQMRAGQHDNNAGNEINQALNEGQRILGLPIAILKEDEPEGAGELELVHQQHQDHQRKAQLFAQRLSDSNNNAGSPAPTVVPNPLLVALNNQQHQHGEQVDYLMNPNKGEPMDQLDSTATGEPPGVSKGVAKEQRKPAELPQHHPLNQQHHHHHQQHHHQDLQRAQQLHRDVPAILGQPHHHQLLQMQQQQQRQVAVAGGGSGVYGQVRPPVMATALAHQGSGLPVRFREISVYRPFGYESHHAIAYQASPTVAALFPALTQSTRPSILRHMTPFRAIQTQRGLLNPMSQVQLADTMRAASAPSPVAHPLDGASYHARQALTTAAGLPLPGDDPLGPARTRYMRITNLKH